MVVSAAALLRTALASALLFAPIAAAQPATYFVPIASRTLSGSGAPAPAIALPDPGVSAAQALLFSTSQGTAIPYLLGTLGSSPVTGFPAPASAVATAPGVLVKGQSRTLVAVVSSASVLLGTVQSGAFVSRGPTVTLPGSAPIALSAAPDGGAVLLVSDSTATALTRWEIDASGDLAVAVQRGSGSVSALNDPASSLYIDAIRDVGYVGSVLGNLFFLKPELDAGSQLFDSALTGQGRLAAPLTGVGVYVGSTTANYLLVTGAQGLTVYDLNTANPLPGAFRVIAKDSLGPVTGPTGLALTNLPAGAALPQGTIALGDPTQHDIALVSWGTLANQVDGGLAIDTTTDPRGPGDAGGGGGGGPDGGCSDGGVLDGGGCVPPPPPPPPCVTACGGAPLGPGIPVPQPSGCTSAPGGVMAVLALAALLLRVPRRRQRR
ncbi:MAG: hypothetical protein ACXWLL_12175 [Myxococcaceae bacterium]